MTPEDFILQLLGSGLTVAELKEKAKQDFTDYCHLLDTMSDEEFTKEIVREFGAVGHKQAGIVLMMFYRIVKLEQLRRT